MAKIRELREQAGSAGMPAEAAATNGTGGTQPQTSSGGAAKAELQALEDRTGCAARRDRPDAGLRGRADRGRSAFRLDRHSCGQDAEGRNRDRARAAGASGPSASSARTHAMEIISQRVQTSRASLDDPNKPVGVFMLVGPSGVGKTETALALSDLLYGGEHNLITINMSEFQEAAYRLHAEGLASGICGLRRRRRADRSGAAPALLRGAAGRSRKGASRRAGAFLPGLRQGQHGGRRRPRRSISRTPSSSSPPTHAPIR